MYNHYRAIIILAAIGLVVLGIGMSLVGSPISQKKLRFDEIRIGDFNTLKYDVENYNRTNGRLPASLNDLNRVDSITDPDSKKSYEYKILSPFSYQLCTDFSTDSLKVAKEKGRQNSYSYTGYSETNTNHKAGYDCMAYTIPNYDRTNYTTPNSIQSANNFQTIYFLKPKTGDTLCLNDTFTIEWDSANAYSQISFYLTKADGERIQSKLKTSRSSRNNGVTPNPISPTTRGTFKWTIGSLDSPGIVSAGSSYYIEARTPETDSLGVLNKNISETFLISNCATPSSSN